MTKAHGDGAPKAELRPDTRTINAGRTPFAHHGYVNPPVYHASTVLYRSANDYLAGRGPYHYARRGTPTTEALESALQEMEGPRCAGVALLPSGLSAICTALQTVLRAGDHVLVTDSCYGPARTYCDSVLNRFGITTSYYDPTVGPGIADLMRANTRLVYTESPGSLSFEMQDIPAVAKAVHARGALVLMDNTWASSLYFRPLDNGVDLAIQSATKYIGGHSDLVLGVVAANQATWPRLREVTLASGLCVAPDDIYLALRGLRTLGVRLARHQQSGLTIAHWLEQRPEVLRVIHPGLPSHPGHALWKRDFSGASGLFSVVLKPVPDKAVHAFLDALLLYGKGVSWGGYESLAIPFAIDSERTASRWEPGGPCVRLHVGLEDVRDLITDLERGFAALAAAAMGRVRQ